MLAGETGITSDEWSFELESPYIPALELPYSVIACICKHLPTQGDRQRACLIHPIWSPAATDSLWQEPVFSNAAAFQGFYKTVHAFKRLALRVHTLNIIHDSHRNASDTIKLSSLPQHRLRESTLAKPEVVIALTRLCENVQSLKIYGWHIRAGHLEKLSTALQGLKHLTIIGSNESLISASSSSFRNLLTRLVTLRLDGVTNINAGFVDLLERRCQQLETLQLGVQDLGPDGFEALTLGKLLVKELILTDCSPLEDSHILELAITFPMLESLILIDAEKLTGEALVNIFEHCRNLRKLDIRNNRQRNSSKPAKAQTGQKELKAFVKSEKLRELTIHGLNLDTITVQTTLYGHHSLQRLWLQTCHELCDDDFRLICQSSHCLEYVKLVDCPGLTGRALSAVIKSHESKAISVQLTKCGMIIPQHLKHFCQAVLGCTYKKLIISQDKGLISSDYASFAGELVDTQEPVYIFDKQALNNLAQSQIIDGNDDGENLISQRTYTLDRKQVAMVAEYLGISSQQLRAAISKVLNTTQSKKFGKGVVAPQRISISPSEGEPSQSKSNIPATSKTLEQREATATSDQGVNTKISNGWSSPKTSNDWPSPKLSNDWSASFGSSRNSPDIRTGTHSPDDNWPGTARKSSNVPKEPEPAAAISPPSASIDQKIVFKYQPLVENSGRNVEIEDEKSTEKVTLAKRSETHQKAAEPSSAIQLGGWGVASSPSWNDSFTRTAVSDEGSNWDATAVERMTWQPAEIVTAPVASKSAKKKGARLFLPASSEADGWGAPPEERVAWDDDCKQGFAHDIIQSQHQTIFWKMEGGVWKKLSAGEQREKERKDAAMEDFSLASPNGKTASASSSITRHILKSTSHQMLDNGLPPTSSREEIDVDAHVLSDDNEDDFTDSDDGVVIKTGADDDLVPSPSTAAVPTNIMDQEETVIDYNSSTFAELPKNPDSPPSHPGNPQWVAYEQWKKSQLQSTAIEHPEGSQAVEIPVDDGGWDDLPAATLNQPEINGGWATEKVRDTFSPTPPIASYKLVDIIEDFNERISSRSTQSRTTSDIKWEGFESSMFSDHDNEENDQFRQLAEDKHDATIQYIKAQAESRQIAREDIIRQTENELNASNSFAAHFESEESKYVTHINGDQYDANRTDDDWVSSTTSEAGYNMSGLGISNKGSRRARNRESRARASARHPMRPEQMAGQWGLFPINDSNVDDSMDHNSQSLAESGRQNADVAETLDDDESSFTHGQTKEDAPQVYGLLNAGNGSFTGSDYNDEFDYKLDTPVESDSRHDYVSSSTADLWDEPDKLTEENLVNMDNVMPATPGLEKYGQKAHTKQYSRNLFDDLMGESVSNYGAPLSTAKEAIPASNNQGTALSQSPRQQSPSLQSPSPQSAAIPNGNSNVTILSVKIETVDVGTQPLVIMEADDPKQAIHDFCVKYGMTEYETKIVDVTLPRYKEKMAKRVLGRAARNSNSPGQSMASPTLANNTSGSMESLL